ncbi:MAG: hypothetical protein M9958_03295 [Chitinophagales bacterium]|nr:hypothetical protein [Chitinophagales bacterium]
MESNHEIWRKCPICGTYNDKRVSTHCDQCGKPIGVLGALTAPFFMSFRKKIEAYFFNI